MFDISIRNYHPSDVKEIVSLFNSTIRAINQKDYTDKQIQHLIQQTPNYDEWNKKLLANDTFVAYKDRTILGFGSISKNGQLHYLYVNRNWINYTIGTMLLKKIIDCATDRHQTIKVKSSITAKPFFEKMGFQTLNLQNTYIEGLLLPTYTMEYRQPPSSYSVKQ